MENNCVCTSPPPQYAILEGNRVQNLLLMGPGGFTRAACLLLLEYLLKLFGYQISQHMNLTYLEPCWKQSPNCQRVHSHNTIVQSATDCQSCSLSIFQLVDLLCNLFMQVIKFRFWLGINFKRCHALNYFPLHKLSYITVNSYLQTVQE